MVGKTISHYQILEKLGEGGMGVVWKAEDTKLKRTVALKFVPPDALGDPDLRIRFLHEAQAAAALSHPNVCTVFDVDEESGFLVMEYIEGETVQARVRRRPLPLLEALDIAMQAAQGLQAAHEHGVVHRDVKGANLMVTPQGTVKIMDFGLARLMGLARATKTGVVAGTTAYMSPEQAQGKAVDRRSDLWSLGVVLYEMMTGQLPFRGDSEAAVIHSVLYDDPESVTALRAGLPLELDRVIRKALEKDPEMRYQSAADLGTDLRRLKRDSNPRSQVAPAAVAAATRPRRKLTGWAAGVAVAVVAAAAGIFLWQRMQAKPLTDKDVLVLADFTNTTGDPVFDGTLREALAVQLEQSPFLKIMGDDQMRQDLRFMGRSAGERITNQIAREICQRESEKAMIGGSIASLGKTYAIALQATNCRTGESMAREQVEAEDKEHVLRAVATAATKMRAKLGESLASIQKLDVPNPQVTTTSLEAFQAFALGREQRFSGSSLAAIPFYQRAIELDPNFASAYAGLGAVYGNVGETGRRAEYDKKAFALIDRVSERERLDISALFYSSGTGELNKAVDAWQLYARTYQRDAVPRNALGNLYRSTGDVEKALPEFQEAVRVEPRFAYAYSNQVMAYSYLDRFDEAKAVAEQAFAQNLDSPGIHQALLRIAYLQEDRAEAGKHIQWMAGKPEEYQSLASQATNAAALGQLRRAGELVGRATEVARRRSLPETVARLQAQEALLEALAGNCEAARSRARAAILPEQAPADTLAAALPLALCGDTAAAQKAADETSKEYPLHTLWNAVQLPSIRAAIELSHNQPEKAVELLQSAAPYERAHPSAVYLRGLAHLRARKGAEAAAEFQKILDHRGANWGPYYPLSYVGLARAAALTGDTARARKAYQDFLALWKDADPDIPILKEAKQEYAKLK